MISRTINHLKTSLYRFIKIVKMETIKVPIILIGMIIVFGVCIIIIGIDRLLDKKESFRYTWGCTAFLNIIILLFIIYFLII